MGLLQPQLGLFVWTLVIFLILFFLMRKFAWKPIMKAIHDREDTIQGSLDEAAKARDEMAQLTSQNEKLLQEARIERDNMLKDAKEVADRVKEEARTDASQEAARMIEKAREEIRSEKMAALTEIKNEVGQLSIDIAEKLLRKKLADDKETQEIVDKMVADLHLN